MASEYGEDIFIRDNVELPKTGFYLDIGCAWPSQYSNTEFLRTKGWKGLAIDGNPIYEKDWNGIAEFRCMVIGDGKPCRFLCHDAPDLSRIGEGEVRTTVPLNTLVDTLPPIDFLSCDLEGQEFTALSTLDWDKHKPKVVVSEYSTYGIGEDYRVRDLLISHGYKAAHQTVANIIYLL